MGGRAKLPLPELDERTELLNPQALSCRGYQHAMVRRPVPAERYLEMAEMGYREEVWICGSGCGYTRTVVYDRASGDIVESHTVYTDKEYLVPSGTGRLAKRDARKALWVREDQELYRTGRRRTPRAGAT
jgi:hypothetical protein